MTEQLPPAGWYADPSDAAQQRYWDGQAWTEHVAPGPAAQAPQQDQSQGQASGQTETQGPYGPASGGPTAVQPSYPGQQGGYQDSAQGGYQASYPGGYPASGGYAPRPTSGAATASLVLGIASLITCLGVLLGVPAMILARKAKRQIAESGGQMDGQGMATAGFWTGLIATILSVLLIAAFVVLIAVGNTISDTFQDQCTTVERADGTTSFECGEGPGSSPSPETIPG